MLKLFKHKPPMPEYHVSILHNRPGFPENIQFLMQYYARADDERELKTLFIRAFESAHPDWTIIKVVTETEK
jgi:hypothetical protein